MRALAVSSPIEIPSIFIQNFPTQDYQASCQNWGMCVSSEGILYVANNLGLLVFDGNTWNNQELPDQSVVNSVVIYKDTVFTGQQNDFGYWTVDDKGLYAYHSIRHLLPELKFRHEIFSTLVVSNGSLWLKSKNYLLRYTDGHLSVFPVPSDAPSRLMKGGEELFLWVQDKGLYGMSEHKGWVLFSAADFVKNHEIVFVHPQTEDSYLLGSPQNGIALLSEETCIPWRTDVDEELKRSGISSFVASGDLFFIGTRYQGIYVLNKEGKLWEHYMHRNLLQDNTVHALYKQGEQQIWAAFDNGISLMWLHSPLLLLEERSEVGKMTNAALYKDTLLIETNLGMLQQKVMPDGRSALEPYSGLLPASLGNKDKELIDRLPVEVRDTLPPFRKSMEEHEQVLWFLQEGNSVYRIRLAHTPEKIESIKIYGQKDGITRPAVTDIAVVDDMVMLATGKGFFRYDKAKDQFVAYELLNDQLDVFASAKMIFPALDGHYWLVRDNEAGLFSIKDGNVILKCRILFDNYNLSVVNREKKIIPLCDSLHLVSAMQGILLINTRRLIENNLVSTSPLRIMNIEYADKSGVHYLPQSEKTIELPSDFRELKIRAATTVLAPTHQISYKLGGISTEWSPWQKEGDISFLQLPVGKYELMIRKYSVKGPYPEISLNIVVNPPWYDTIWAYLFYLLLIWLAGHNGLRYYLDFQRKKEHNLLESERLEEQQKMDRLKNEMLESELQNKNNELTLQTSLLVKKNQSMQSLMDELERQKEILGDRYPNKLYAKMKGLIGENLNSQADWMAFENYFNSAHQHFIERLRSRYADLTTGDLRICCLLRMNLSTKEIASLLNISVRSVELRRYRLRKRLSLEGEENLVDFLLSI